MSSMSKRKYRMSDRVDFDVLEATSEKFRIEVDTAIQKFISDPSELEYSFSASLNNLERKYIHQKAANYNLHSRSHGKDPNRTLTISKKHNKSNFESFYIDISAVSQEKLNKLNYDYELKYVNDIETTDVTEKGFGKFVLGTPPPVIRPNVSKSISNFQKLLPIYEVKDEVITTIRDNKVIIISSETGSGKTTQIPQYILDDCLSRNENCRILCTQPRRISAVSVAERVAEERGSKIGDIVGYQVRLETKIGPKSNLIYCTNGVLIRNLMSGDGVLSSLTHIIIDEVHERDKLSDFLLICLRESLRNGSHIKLILMSATINKEKFLNYFENAAILKIPGRLYHIKELFIDEILEITNYLDVLEKHNNVFDVATTNNITTTTTTTTYNKNDSFDDIIISLNESGGINCDDLWNQLLLFILNENMPPNYQETITGINALMIAVNQENVDMVEKLCNLGCDPKLKNNCGLSALDIADFKGNQEICLLLNMVSKASLETITNQKDLLKLYYKTITDDDIDFDLLTRLICTIHEQFQDGAILVFLPGYDDIMIANDRIESSQMNKTTYKVFFLHGSMNIKEQHDVFKPIYNKRKIILSTNIAETSLTIDDVVYVIDSGKAKVLTYDSCNGLSSLQTQWISKACVKQRAGRAGRTNAGMAFHLFSQLRYQSLLDERIPEILRVPLEELCLNTKTLAKNFSIYDFLVKAPDPPSSNTVKTAIENLQCLGALDNNENLTKLGEYLSQLTIEPHLGKMLIYSAIFKCLDPVLTIVASLAQKDPFQLPPQANKKCEAAEKRKSLYDGTLSDHFIYLKAFIKWQNSLHIHKEKQFCNDYFISFSTMETILKTRSQLLKQLKETKFVLHYIKSMSDINIHSDNWPLIKAIISAGLYPKMSYKKGNIFCTRTEKKVLVNNLNIINKETTTSNIWLVYDEIVKVRGGNQIRGVTPITPITIPLMCGIKITTPMDKYITIDDWLEFEFPNSNIIKLRKLIDNIIIKKLFNPKYIFNIDECFVIKTLADILFAEEIAINMPLPIGINQRPKVFEFLRDDNSRMDVVQQILRDNAFTFTSRHQITNNNNNNNNNNLLGNHLYRTINSNTPPITINNNNNGAIKKHYNNSIGQKNKTNYKGGNYYQQQQQQNHSINNKNNYYNHNNSGGSGGNKYNNYNHHYHNKKQQNNYYNNDNCYNHYNTTNGYHQSSNGQYMDIASALPPSNEHIIKWQNYDMSNSKFFIIKSKKQSSMMISYENSCWTFAASTEKKILSIDNKGLNVFLFYVVPDMNSFYGLARFLSLDFVSKGRPFGRIEWIIAGLLPFKDTRHLRNPLNDNRLVYDAVDGQEVDKSVAVLLWDFYLENVSNIRRPPQTTNNY